METSSKVKIPEGTRREVEFLFHHEIVTTIKKHNIPGSMIINIDQAPLKYVPTSNFTVPEKGATSVAMEGGSVKDGYSITFSNEFLSMQLIYDEKIVESLYCFKFP